MKNYIEKHLNYYYFSNEQDNEVTMKLYELQTLLDLEEEIDSFFSDTFPIEYFGKKNDLLNISFAGNIIKILTEIKDFKIDLTEEMKNITYIGLDNENELIIEFNNAEIDSEAIICNCIYDSSYDFLELFSMGKYGANCIKNDQNDILRENIEYQINYYNSMKMKYRMLKRDENYYMRAVVSEKYHNYNNNLLAFTTMGLLHKFSIENNIKFEISSAQISDSGIRIFITSDREYIIKGFAKIKLGLYITNGELRDKTFSCSIRYTVIDLKNNKLSFNILTDKVEEFIFDIMHTLSYGTAKNKILEINKLLSISESMIHHIKDLSDANKLDGDTLFQLFTNITKDRTGTISSESKKNFQELYDKNLTSNSYSIIEAFNLIGKMFTKIDEKLFLEKTYYEVLKALSKK